MAITPFQPNTSFLQGISGLKQDRQATEMSQMKIDAYKKQQADTEEASLALRDYYKTQNPESLVNATLKSPQLAGQVLQSIGIVDDQQKKAGAADIAMLWQARGNPEAFRGAMAKRVDGILQRQGNPSDSISLGMLYEQDPAKAEQMLKVAAAGLEAQGYKTGVFGDQKDQMSAYQQASTDLRKQELEFKRQEKQTETQLKILEAQMKREDNDLKKQDLQLKIQEQQQKLADLSKQKEVAANEKVAGLESARSNLDNMLNTLARVENTDMSVIENATGPIDQMVPTIRQSTADFEELVGTLGSQAFLSQIPLIKGMGQLSNAEGEKLQSALQNFSLRQSPERLKENLAEARRLLTKARANIAKQYGAPETKPDTPAAGSQIGRFKVEVEN